MKFCIYHNSSAEVERLLWLNHEEPVVTKINGFDNFRL